MDSKPRSRGRRTQHAKIYWPSTKECDVIKLNQIPLIEDRKVGAEPILEWIDKKKPRTKGKKKGEKIVARVIAISGEFEFPEMAG